MIAIAMMTVIAAEEAKFDLQGFEFCINNLERLILLLDYGTNDFIDIDHVVRISEKSLNFDDLQKTL